VSKTAKRPLLPDGRLRLDRRPKWLDAFIGFKIKDFLYRTSKNAAGMNGREFVLFITALVGELNNLTAGDDHPIDPFHLGRRCRVCQCTEDDCSGCIELTGSPCCWSPLDPTVCTACVLPIGGPS
jgi:hypothetical protein